MPTHRRYTKADKAKAVAAATLTSTEAAAEATGIPRTTIAYWLDSPEFVELRQKTRDDVAEAMWSAIQIGVQRIVALIPTTDDLQKVSVATGILYDKHALMTGGATGRTESRDLTGTLSDGDITAALRAAHDIAVGGRTPSPAEDAPAG